jgi:hypothetical protein
MRPIVIPDPALPRPSSVFEVGTLGPAVAVRDSAHRDGPQLAFAANTWKTFTDQVKAGA